MAATLTFKSHLRAETEEKKLTSNFNQNWLKCIISIEVVKKNKQDSAKKEEHIPIGTGFLIESPGNHYILITAKHVIFDEEEGKIRNNLSYRLNDKKGQSILITEEQLKKYPLGSWFWPSNGGFACRFIVVSKTSDIACIPREEFLGYKFVQAGAPILLLGFPMGLRSKEYALPIVRSGTIARSDSKTIIVDTYIYPGNSGGPILYIPNIKISGGLLKSALVNKEKLVGLAIKYIPYIDTAVSLQTKRARITFEENSGLCIAIPTDIISSFLKRNTIIKLDNQVSAIFKEEKM